MKLRWVPNSFGRAGIIASSEGNDTHPVFAELWIEYNIDNFTQDRFAVASALLFGTCVNGRLAFEAGVSQNVSKTIEVFLDSCTISVDPVVFEENPFPPGDSIIVLHDGETQNPVANRLGEQREIDLIVVPSDQYAGGLLQMERLTIASNAWLHSPQGAGGNIRWYPYIAVAVLLAADLSAGAIRLDSSNLGDVDQESSLHAMLHAVGLNLLS